jgi:signal transduction histidine kinase
VAKYAEASHCAVRIARENGVFAVEVRDDGKGGALATPGSGLSGLADRVGAADGTLIVTSPPGDGTVVRAELPLQA